ncbi:uncharacterized protein LOC128241360 [Mya arenaria]|uniref:uncharacterized protein LOC128241360 n=1 Tax=Mya arenaria TaxID=6604 RepID=UPI0022E36190|nr:uncharacterized protein LOC128241360 [Mya arenaria]
MTYRSDPSVVQEKVSKLLKGHGVPLEDSQNRSRIEKDLGRPESRQPEDCSSLIQEKSSKLPEQSRLNGFGVPFSDDSRMRSMNEKHNFIIGRRQTEGRVTKPTS